jgi:hypothetical protein
MHSRVPLHKVAEAKASKTVPDHVDGMALNAGFLLEISNLGQGHARSSEESSSAPVGFRASGHDVFSETVY